MVIDTEIDTHLDEDEKNLKDFVGKTRANFDIRH